MHYWSLENLFNTVTAENFLFLSDQFKKAAELSFGQKCQVKLKAQIDGQKIECVRSEVANIYPDDLQSADSISLEIAPKSASDDTQNQIPFAKAEFSKADSPYIVNFFIQAEQDGMEGRTENTMRMNNRTMRCNPVF